MMVQNLNALVFVFVIAATLIVLGNDNVSGDNNSSTIGISKEKPESGPFVKVDAGFMVPYTARIPGTDITFEMIPVPGGTFQLGSPENEENRRKDEGPQVAVSVDPMWVAKTEVNWEQYDEFMNLHYIFQRFEAKKTRVVDETNRSDAITAPTPLHDPAYTFEYGQEPEQPAVTMTLYAAQQFSKWLSGITGEQYRLPTEAEWEYAARGGTSTPYSWGTNPDAIDDYAFYFDNCDDGVKQLAAKKPNPFGLYDMHGSVAEWTVNKYTEDGYKAFVGKSELKASEMVLWRDGESPGVIRGGSWEDDVENLRSAARLPSGGDEWKDADPNIPKSAWWFTSDPTRGVGFRVFRSYKPLPKNQIVNFWDTNSKEVKEVINYKIEDNRAYLGLVDEDLPKAIEAEKQR